MRINRLPSLSNATQHAQRGVALIMVIFMVALLTAMTIGFVVLARNENLQARHQFETTAARYAAEAGIARAIFEMDNPILENKWVPDGREYSMQFEGTEIQISLEDETGKVDINAADITVLKKIFELAGVEMQQAIELADAVIDWRDQDDLVSVNGAEDRDYEAAGLDYGAGDTSFRLTSEIQQVLGMDYDIYKKIEPWITIYTGSGMPNPAFAPPELLQLFEGISPEMALQLIEQRRRLSPTDPAAAALTLPGGQSLLAGGGGGVYTVRSKATMPNGMWSELHATIRSGGATQTRPYTVLRWREGSAG